MSVEFTAEPRRRRERSTGGSRRAQREARTPDVAQSPQSSRHNRHPSKPSYDNWPEPVPQDRYDWHLEHRGGGGSIDTPVPRMANLVSDADPHLHNPEVGAFSVDPNAPTLGQATGEEMQTFDAEHRNDPRADLSRRPSTKKFVGGFVKTVGAVGAIPKAMMNNYNEGYERRKAMPGVQRVQMQNAAAAAGRPPPPPMQMPVQPFAGQDGDPLSDFSHAAYPTSSGHDDGGTTLVNHDPPPFIPPPNTPQDGFNHNGEYPVKTESGKYYGNRHGEGGQGLSFRRFLSRVSQFIHDLNALPWISPERVTVDYIPNHGKRSRGATGFVAPDNNADIGLRTPLTGSPATPRRLRQTLSWYDGLQPVSVLPLPNNQPPQQPVYAPQQLDAFPPMQNVSYQPQTRTNRGVSPVTISHPSAMRPAGTSTRTHKATSPVRNAYPGTPQYPNGYVSSQPTDTGHGVFSGPNAQEGNALLQPLSPARHHH